MGYVHLALAIIGEVIGTNLLKASNGFSKLVPAVFSLIAYAVCFYFLSLSIKTIHLNVAYAIWGGVGIVLTTLIAVFFWKEPINGATLAGIALILIGSLLLNLFGANGH